MLSVTIKTRHSTSTMRKRNSIEDAKDALEDEQSESEEGNVFDYGPSDDESSGVEGGR